jgi:hypothetical protein
MVVCKPRLREKSARSYEAVNRSLRGFVPSDIECEEFRKEFKLAVWEIVMDPPCHRLPAGATVHPIGQPGDDDSCKCPHVAVFAPAVPDMAGSIFLVQSTAETMPASELIHFGRAIRRSNCEASECRLKGVPVDSRRARGLLQLQGQDRWVNWTCPQSKRSR